jgi:hypothetical protein
MPPRKKATEASGALCRPDYEHEAALVTGPYLHQLIAEHEAAWLALETTREAYYQARAKLVAALQSLGLERWPP